MKKTRKKKLTRVEEIARLQSEQRREIAADKRNRTYGKPHPKNPGTSVIRSGSHDESYVPAGHELVVTGGDAYLKAPRPQQERLSADDRKLAGFLADRLHGLTRSPRIADLRRAMGDLFAALEGHRRGEYWQAYLERRLQTIAESRVEVRVLKSLGRPTADIEHLANVEARAVLAEVRGRCGAVPAYLTVDVIEQLLHRTRTGGGGPGRGYRTPKKLIEELVKTANRLKK